MDRENQGQIKIKFQVWKNQGILKKLENIRENQGIW